MKDKFKLKSSSSFWKLFFLASLVATAAYSCSSGPKIESTTPEIASTPVPVPILQNNESDIAVSVSSSKAPDGSLLWITIAGTDLGKTKNWKVSFEGVDFPTFAGDSPNTLNAAVVVPFNSKPRSTKIEVSWKHAASGKTQTLPIDVIDGQYRSEVLTVDPAHVNPPKSAIKRIMAEQKEIGRLYWASDSIRHWKGSFTLPIQSEMTSPFGNKRVYNGEMKSFHQGLDLRAAVGTPIRAPGAGRVALAKDLYFTGNTVIIDHGLGLFTIYGHMSKLEVKKGQKVAQGDLLGLSGVTGRASGPHLHWGAVLQRLKFNPQDLIRVLR